jgi:hypothetical protein
MAYAHGRHRCQLSARSLVSWLAAAQVVACAAPGEDAPIVTEAVSHTEDRGVPVGDDLAASARDYLLAYAGELDLAASGDFAAIALPDGFGGLRRASAQETHEGLPVLGSTLDVRAGEAGFVGFSGTVTRNLDGFDVVPTVGEEAASAVALAGLLRFTPTDAAGVDAGASELVVAPRAGDGADLAWQIELTIDPGTEEPPVQWVALVHAQTGALLALIPGGGGCSIWDRLKCELLPYPARALCLDLVCGGGEEEVCGDHVCAGDETDASCRQDCGCTATSSCELVAPYGCWCDADCGGSGDCCSDASTCYLPPGGEQEDGTCGHGEKSAGFLDRARLTFYRMKYYAIAEAGGVLKDAPEARDYLLHYLGNSGSDVDVDVDKMLAEIPSFRDKVKEDRTRYGEEAAMRAKQAHATGAVTSAIPDETLSHSVEQAESYNWWAAIHSFEYKHVGEVRVTPSGDSWSYTVKSKIVLRDKYDWDPSAPNSGPGGAFDQGELDELNCYGWAQEFWCTGMTDDEGELTGVWR